MNRGILGFPRRNKDSLPICTVGTLGSGRPGDRKYATDLRVFDGAGTRETAGNGTGGECQCRGGTSWVIAGTNVAAAA